MEVKEMAINKILKLEGASIPWTYKQLHKFIGQEKVSFDNLVQRSYVWEIKRRSEFIWSIIMGYPIPPIYAKRGETDNEAVKVYDVLDGQQRSLTVSKFLNDEYALSDLKPIPYIDDEGNEQEIDISGKKFSELDEEIQDAICDRSVSIFYFDDISQEQQAEMFRRLNNGKPLSTKSRVLASCKNIDGLLEIGSHVLFDEMLTKRARENKNQAVITMKAWCMLYQNIEDVSFESKVFNPMLEKTDITETQKRELNYVFDYAMRVHNGILEKGKKKIAKKMYTETHFISLVPFLSKADDENIDPDMVADWIIEFFDSDNETSVSNDYNMASSRGSAKPMNIQTRHKTLADSYEIFFKEG